MNTTRTYTMRARGDAVAQTRRDILAAAWALSAERLSFAIVLADVAERAGVTVRTILRHFGSREGLFDALAQHVREEVTAERETPVGDTRRAVATIVAHYELRGDLAMRMLEQESVDDRLARETAGGRRLHRDWVRAVFAPQLDRAGDRATLEDLLVVATDVYTWKLLRRDNRLGRTATEQRMHTLIRRLIGEED